MRILIVAPAWVGDMVMAHTLVQRLDEIPGVELHVLAPPATAPLATRMREVRCVHELPVGRGELALGVRRAVGRRLMACRFDQAIVLPNSWKSALVPWFARVPRRTGWWGEFRVGLLNDGRRLPARRYPLMIERFLALATDADADLSQPYPRPCLRVDADRVPELLRALGLATSPRVLALCPGAEYGPSKRWPAAHFARVASHHAASGGQVWLFGSPADRAATQAIVDAVAPPLRDSITDLAGHTRLLDAVDLLSLADRVVTNDSGLMHVAAALARPLIALYGSTSPEFTPPQSTSATVLREPLPCSPCFERTCRFGHTDCLNRLAPERVIAALGAS